MAQVTPVTSEALQAQIRSLLPSQVGFGEDLQASNVIIPVIDLTSTAEGSSLNQTLQSALNFGGATAFDANNSTATLASVGGFYRVTAGIVCKRDGSATVQGSLKLTDGSSTKIMWALELRNTSGEGFVSENIDYTFFLRSGDTLTAVSDNANVRIIGSVRQVADLTGNLVNPTGFTSE
jgi:hypothetical protein